MVFCFLCYAHAGNRCWHARLCEVASHRLIDDSTYGGYLNHTISIVALTVSSAFRKVLLFLHEGIKARMTTTSDLPLRKRHTHPSSSYPPKVFYRMNG